MNCFDWQNHSSDYLDGIMPPALKREADEHLERCKSCTERHQHYRLLLSSIAGQPRSALPIPIRKAPFNVALPRIDMARLGRSRWEHLPWYVRTTLEGSGIVLLILLGISAGPKVRAFYDRKMERSLDEFSQSFGDPAEGTDPAAAGADAAPTASAQLTRGRPTSSGPGSGPDADFANSAEGESESEGDGEAESAPASHPAANDEDDDPTVEIEATGSGAPQPGGNDVRVSKNEIWRFMIRSDNPREFRSQVVQVLSGLKLPPGTPGLGGSEAPGGIVFDLMLPQSVVAGLKHQLEGIAPPPPKSLANTPMGETFTWYKNKSRREIPAGRTRVVIWLSQL